MRSNSPARLRPAATRATICAASRSASAQARSREARARRERAAAQELRRRLGACRPARCSSAIGERLLAAGNDQLARPLAAPRPARRRRPPRGARQIFSGSPSQQRACAGRGPERAHRALELERRPRPVEPRLALVDLRARRSTPVSRLRRRLRARPASISASAATISSRAERGELVVQRAGVVVRARSGRAAAASTGPVSRPASICMMEMPVSRVAGEQRALDRRRAAPARQQRGVDVECAVAAPPRAAAGGRSRP